MFFIVPFFAGIQNAYHNRSRFQLTDSAAYFFNQVRAVGAPNYLPSEQDVLRSRVRTTGIVESEFSIELNKFKIFDVGGQRNERKKWIHCFSEVTAVLFVAAMSEYDMVLFEDETANRMVTVHIDGIRVALRQVYTASHVADELGLPR